MSILPIVIPDRDISQRKSKVRTFSERGRATVKERSTKPNTVDITATTADESSIAHPHGKNVA